MGVIADRRGLVSKLRLLTEEFKLLNDNRNYNLIMNTIQMIEEIIYLNECLLQDVGILYKRTLDLVEHRVPSMDLLEEILIIKAVEQADTKGDIK